MDIALTVLGKIAEYSVAPVGRQFGYLFHFNINFETLTVEVGQLENDRNGIQMRVQAARNNVEAILPAVQKWLDDANKIGDEARAVIGNKAAIPDGCFNQWCLNLKLRYVLSRKAKKKMEEIMKLRQDGRQLGNIACPAAVPPVEASTSTTRIVGTRKWILDEIIGKLKDDNINMVGICGMGGVGKTTIANEVLKRVKDEKLFDDCAMAVISQTQDLAKVQIDIAEMLGLVLNEQNPIVRGAKLHRRLGNSRVLVILDDVWAEFDLKLLGITFEEGCKVLFTSREQGLWRDLSKKIDFPLAVLQEKEAWDLFVEKVRYSLEDKPDFQPVAEEIVKECGGLPLALVTIGGALIGKSIHVWKDTLRQLRMDYPSKIQGVSAKVYQSLELSYNFLEEDAKSLFLLCCLFEEDAAIPIESLVRMGMGLRLFRGIHNNIEQARDRVIALIEQLQSCSLLLPAFSIEKSTKMHDVVRDVAKSIALVERGVLVVDSGDEPAMHQEQGFTKDLIWISINSRKIKEFPTELSSPRVKLLRCSATALQTADYYFKRMGELRVLIVHGEDSPRLPSSLQLPSSLRTLYFRNSNLNDGTIIGDLPNLESLDFVQSQMIELPIEIGRLTNLVSLRVMTWPQDIRIRPGIISRLCQLQELYMRGVDIDWEGEENKDGENASLSEFESLSNLHTLHIKIKDPSVLPRSPLFRNLKKYVIQIGEDFGVDDFLKSLYYEKSCSTYYEKSCSISLRAFVPTEGTMEYLSYNSEELTLKGKFTRDLVHKLVQNGSQTLKHLRLFDIDSLKYVGNATAPLILESLTLGNLINLERICCNPCVGGSFKKLKQLQIYDCPQLRNIFQVSIVSELVHLESLYVRCCESLEEVTWKEKEDATNKLAFPKLEILQIRDLPRFINFCIGIDEIEFPRLKDLYIGSQPQLECPFSGLSNQSIFSHKVSFPSLESMVLSNLLNMKKIWYGQLQSGSFHIIAKLTLSGCHGLRTVFTPLLARYLVHLYYMSISDCSLLEVVVGNEEAEVEVQDAAPLPKLKSVELRKLPALETFCHMAHDLEFPVLDFLWVCDCPKLKAFFLGSLRTPNLNKVTLSWWIGEKRETIWVDDLNSTIRHLYQQQLQQQQ